MSARHHQLIEPAFTVRGVLCCVSMILACLGLAFLVMGTSAATAGCWMLAVVMALPQMHRALQH